jgi:hypothetical protein
VKINLNLFSLIRRVRTGESASVVWFIGMLLGWGIMKSLFLMSAHLSSILGVTYDWFEILQFSAWILGLLVLALICFKAKFERQSSGNILFFSVLLGSALATASTMPPNDHIGHRPLLFGFFLAISLFINFFGFAVIANLWPKE